MKKEKKNKKVKKVKKHRKLRFALKLGFLMFLVLILLAITIFYFLYGKKIFDMQNEAKKMVANATDETFRATQTSVVYNSKGEQIAALKGEKDVYYLEYKDIPQSAVNAMIVTEDKKFFQHKGVDFLANFRAALALVRNNGKITQGASTITQQLSRNVFLSNQVSYERKIKEIFVSMELEKKFSKEKILEFYMNNIYFANGYYGIEAASKGYFDKSASELSLGQICFLCSIPNNPTLYDPVEKFDNTVARKNRILDQMLADQVISQADYNTAYNETIKLNIPEVKKKNYVETFIINSATKKLMQLNGFEFKYSFKSDDEKAKYDESYNTTYSECQQSLYTAGYKIYTSIDTTKQKTLQKSIDNTLDKFKDKSDDGTYKMQSAGVCIDNETGRVVAVVGGRSQKSNGYTLNRAYQSFRQPGSSIKPLIVYTPIFEREYSTETIVKDEKTEDGPENSNGKYQGNITLRKAIEQSKNTIAWALYKELTPKVGLEYLLNMGFTKIVDNDYYLSTALGGFTHGVSPLEMASGYAAIANDGEYREPTCIVKILDAQDNVVVSDEIKKKTVYQANAARMMTDVMTGVLKYGTGAGLALDNMHCAGKTGTTNDKKDGWFCGFTPYYTTSIWVGCDTPVTVNDLMGNTYPGTIWKNYMNEIHKGLQDKAFPEFVDLYKPKATPKPTAAPKATKSPDGTDANIIEETPQPSDAVDNTGEGTPTDNGTTDNGNANDGSTDTNNESTDGATDNTNSDKSGFSQDNTNYSEDPFTNQ